MEITVDVAGVKFDVEFSYEGDRHDELSIQMECITLLGDIEDSNLVDGYLSPWCLECITAECYKAAERDWMDRRVS